MDPIAGLGKWVSADVACDRSGVAIWDGVRLVRAFEVRTTPGRWLATWSPFLADAAIRTLVQEDGFVGVNARTSLALAGARSSVEVVAEAVGCDRCIRIPIAKWRAAVGIKAADRDSAKAEASAKCRWLASDPATRPPPSAASASAWFFMNLHLPMASGASIDAQEAILIGVAYLRTLAEKGGRGSWNLMMAR